MQVLALACIKLYAAQPKRNVCNAYMFGYYMRQAVSGKIVVVCLLFIPPYMLFKSLMFLVKVENVYFLCTHQLIQIFTV
jgi:hypothetical protein